jgi:hypothetical protein
MSASWSTLHQDDTAAELRMKLGVSEKARALDQKRHDTELALAWAARFWTGLFFLLLGIVLGGFLVVWIATGVN